MGSGLKEHLSQGKAWERERQQCVGSEKEHVLGSLAGYHLFILQGRNEGEM